MSPCYAAGAAAAKPRRAGEAKEPDTADLSGRNAIVTGADSETGGAIGRALAGAGARVAITTTSSDAEEALSLRRLSRAIETQGGSVLTEAVDLANGASVQVAVRQIARQMGEIDLLVSAPRLSLLRPAERLSDAEWARALGYNLGAHFYACRAVAREMLARPQPGGRIVLLLTRPEANDGGAALAAAFGGAQALVEALAREWRPRDVIVNAVAVSVAAEDAVVTEAVLRLVEAGDSGLILDT